MSEYQPTRGGMLRRTSSADSLGVALIALAIATLFVAGLEVALLLDHPAGPVWVLLLFVGVGVEYVLAGLLAWSRRPSNRTGALLCVGGLSLLAAALQNTDLPGLVAVGLILGVAPIGVILHILLAFPRGRVHGSPVRALVVCGYVVTIVLQAPQYLFSDVSGPTGVLQLNDRPDLLQIATWVQRSLGVVVIVLTAVVLAHRLRSATSGQRRVLGVLYAYGIAAILFLEVAVNVLPPLFGFGPITVFVLQISAFAGVPVAFAAGVLRGGFARTSQIDELRAQFETQDGGRMRAREALARALGDESLELLFWLPEREEYVDASGAVRALPRVGSGRAGVEIEAAGRRVGAIVYDELLIDQPELVRSAGRVISLELERERLTAELLASRQALRESRARIIHAADRERRRIARDLHDGLQARLVLLAIQAGRIVADLPAADLGHQAREIRSGLDAASDELRALVQGVMPALLIERGLYAATEDLVDRMPVTTRLVLSHPEQPLPSGVQRAGYFVVAEALTNAVKHSRASELTVNLARDNGQLKIEIRDDGVGGAHPGEGTGLRGIADRLDVLGGRLLVHSPPGQGTLVRAELPCGS
ncbi:MAG: histidine kinase [Actinomycetota bacterium]|nr:histidine kinase [Actinomycetota bacterium]